MSEPGAAPAQEEHWTERPQRRTRIQLIRTLSLLAEGRNVLVRAEFRRTRRGRWLATAICVGVPLACLAAAYLLSRREEGPSLWATASPSAAWWAGFAVVTFVSFWPLVMFLGAALSSAAAVLAERSEGTAFQPVLAPFTAEALAAAKILPRVRPFLWGVLAALPLYLWAGGAEALSVDGRGLTPLVSWPFRMLTPLIDRVDMTPSIAGLVAGLFMLLADAGMVWAAAHWGACYALWLGSVPGMLLYLGWRLIYLSVTYGLWNLLPAAFLALLGHPSSSYSDTVMVAGAVVAVMQGMLLLGFLYAFPWRGAVRMTLEEFARFDRLCDDEFQSGYFKRFSLRAAGRGEERP